MYTINVPTVKSWTEKEKDYLLKICRDGKIYRIFVTMNLVLCDDFALEKEIVKLKEKLDFLNENKIKSAVWLYPTLGYEGTNGIIMGEDAKNFTRKRVLRANKNSKYSYSAFCPLDNGFVKEFSKCIAAVASLNPELIMLEDDFYLTGYSHKEMGCCCKNHMREYFKIINQKMPLEQLVNLIYSGGENLYRNAWYQLKADTMLKFTKRIREAVNTVNKQVRIGLCANTCAYEQDGVSIAETALAAAGETRPFIRLTSAPYWEEEKLSTIIESVRLQKHWIRDKGIELLSEGDTYPRPRLQVPASYLECFDMVLRADGGTDGILKYMLEYNSALYYETGYIDRHIRNLPNAETIDKIFGNKKSIGVNIFEHQDKITKRVFDEVESLDDISVHDRIDTIMPASLIMMNDNCIPTAYDAPGYATIIFGENARHIDLAVLKNGAILDFKAALILQERGVDVGINGYRRMLKPNAEYFYSENDRVIVGHPNPKRDSKFYKIDVASSAKILSQFNYDDDIASITLKTDGQESFAACYLYENANKERVAVYSFVAATVKAKASPWHTGVFRSYYRQNQLKECIEWVQQRPMPAFCKKNPDLYILCKKGDDNSMAVGIWNFNIDCVYDAEVELDDTYTNVEIFGGTGYLNEKKLTLTTSIIPFGYVSFVVK